MKKARPRKPVSRPVSRTRRNRCLICGDVIGTARSAQEAHMLKVHLPDGPAIVADSYAEFYAGVPEMKRTVKEAMKVAKEVMELERLFSLPDRRRRTRR